MGNAFMSVVTLPLDNPVLIFAILLFVILLVPIALQSFKIPDVIGLIAAGALLGPRGFHVMERDSSIVLFGTVGLLYIMFLAGLEVNMADFKKNSAKGFIFGMFTFWIPALLGIFAGRCLLGFSWGASILLASMFASNTLLTYPIASKYGVTKNRSVTIAVMGAVVTCVLALLVLAVATGMSTGELGQFFWWRLGLSTLLACAGIIFLFPVCTRWFFKRYDDKVLQYIFVLGLLFLASFLAEVAGLAAVIGSFLAGLSLNKLIPNTSALMNRIEFVGNALFIPLFLVGVGMLVDYRVFAGDWNTLCVAAVMTVLATASKFAAAWLAQKSFRLTVAERNLVFGLSNSRVAATLAAVMVGYQVILPDGSRLLDDSILNGTIVMILGTCVIASFVTRRGAREVALADMAGEDIAADDTGERVLIPLSNVTNVEELVSLAVSLKSARGESTLAALHVIRSDNAGPPAEREAGKLLEGAVKTAAAMDAALTPLTRYDYDVANGIKHAVKEQKITDLVLGLSGEREITDSFLGRLIDKVLAKCAATTLIYRPVQPLSTVRRYVVLIPHHAEKEVGFPYWLLRVWNLARNLGNKMIFYAGPVTLGVLREIHARHPIHAEFNDLPGRDDFLIVSREVKGDDGLVIVMSRRNYPSYARDMAALPAWLNKHFSRNNCLLIYPVQIGVGEEGMGFVHLVPRLEAFENLDGMSRVLRELFRKNK
ncbi:MAG: cation:proton antiporter [Odoribacteraceae bacterium]|jgi:Kef-type K+ transport system membrane component KefB/nucleotide-binding universal stress UspA family protein|nr:cation:proton antiporter [Odoribacteraceae bacterium]